MKSKPVIRVEIDPSCREPEVIIRTDQRTAFIDNILAAIGQLSEREQPKVTAYRGGTRFLLDQREIVRGYTERRKLVICAERGLYEARCTLRELEEILDADQFQRISRFEIINLDKVSGFDFGLSGTIKVTFADGSSTWVSRRYIRAIQQTLEASATAKEGRL